jgi:nucleotide-binding universal stress UspA family protein
MKLPHRILAATDFSDVSEHALVYARDLARALGAELLLLHVYEVPMLAFPIEGMAISPATWAADLSSHWQRKLDAAAVRHRGEGVSVTAVLRNGVPHEEIHRIADAERADLIVVGTHGRTGAGRLLLGSVAERVIRTATRPVLSVSPKAG